MTLPACRERAVGEVLALLTGNDRSGIELPPANDADGHRATQAGVALPSCRAGKPMGPEALCLTRALKPPTPPEPVTRLAEQARRVVALYVPPTTAFLMRLP